MRLPERIPPLHGRWLTAYRVLWVAVFVLALIATTLGLAASDRNNRVSNQTFYRLGVMMGRDDVGNRQLSPLAAPAGAPGVRPYSAIVAIDGRPWPRRVGYDESRAIERALGGPDGTVHRLQLRNPAGITYSAPLTVRAANLAAFDRQSVLPLSTRLLVYDFATGFMSILYVLAATLLFWRRVHEPVAALLSFGLLAYIANGAMVVSGYGSLIDVTSTHNLGAPLLAAAWLVFPSGRFEPRWTLFAIPLMFVPLALSYFVSQTVETLAEVFVIGLIVAANLIRYRRMPSTIERLQVRWAMLGIVAAMVMFALQTLLVLVQRGIVDGRLAVAVSLATNVLTVLIVAALIGGLLISLLRYRLYDVDTVLSKSAAYGILAVTMIAVFAGTEKLIELTAEEYWGESGGATAGAIAAGVAAAVVPLFHRRLERWAERRFQGSLLALRDCLPEDLRDWRETERAEDLAARALARLTGALHSRGGAIIACAAADKVLACEGCEAGEPDAIRTALPLEVPLGRLADGSDGLLLLGPRPDGTPPGKDEREAAAAIADPLGRALSVAQRRQAHEAELTAALAALADRVARLESGRTKRSA
jgi:hypothetical protein